MHFQFNDDISIQKQAKHSYYPFFLLLIILLLPLRLLAIDVVTVNVGESENDPRILFKNELVQLALEITKDSYGDFKIVENPSRMNIARAFRELEKGENLSLTFAHTRREFEEQALPVRVSFRGGIDSYRLLMIQKGQEAKFEDIQTLEDLKKYSVGLSPNWATYKIMQEEGFNIVDAPNYSSMFRMLEKGRFDFIPRAVNEIYGELSQYESNNEGLSVLPNVALFIPSVSYMFVSPKQPRLYKRLNSGMHALSISGDLAKLIDKHYRKFIEQAKIQNRQVIALSHSELKMITPKPSYVCDCETRVGLEEAK